MIRKITLILFILYLIGISSPAYSCNPLPCIKAKEVSLTWDPPTTNTDGTPLTDLAGYKIYYGLSSGNYTDSIDVENNIVYGIYDLVVGLTYYFAVTAYDTSSNESDYSNEVSLLIEVLSYPPVKLLESPFVYYSTLQTAIDNAVDGTVMQSQEVTFNENIVFNAEKSVAWQGGYNCDYTGVSGKTTVKGTVTVVNGVVTIDNFIINNQ